MGTAAPLQPRGAHWSPVAVGAWLWSHQAVSIAPPLVARPEAATPDWLTSVLRHAGALGQDSRVASIDWQSIGTGQVGSNVRFLLGYEGEPGPPSLVGKFASEDPDSASAGVNTLTYETEVAFYRDIAPTVEVSRPRCYFAAVEAGTANVVLILEDLHPAQQGDQLAGCTVEQAELAVTEAARLHGPRWADPALEAVPWLARERGGDLFAVLPTLWQGFVERYGQFLAPVTLDQGPRLMELFPLIRTPDAPRPTPVHGDFRLDNMLFDPTGQRAPVTVVDWQTVSLGVGTSDVAYFLGNCFADPGVRRANEQRLLQQYHQVLTSYGVAGYPLEQCWDDYRRSSYASMLMAIFASMIVGRTDRGDQMFVAMADRSAQMAADLDAPGALGER
jgi:hypothetical protein